MRRPPPVKSGTKDGPRRRGRPRVHAEAWVKVSVVLFVRQVVHLDRVADRAHQRGHPSVSRAGLIRGVIDGLLNTGMDLSVHASERALRDHVTKRIRRA